MNKIARTSADHLSHAWATIPHVTQHELVDVTELETGRKRFVQARPDVKLTMTVLAMKAVVTALRQFPNFNSSLDAASGELILKDYYHIGIAVDTEHGLLVPVIRDVDKKTCVELAQELVAISDRARARKLSLDEMRGGTFTITNLGGIGGTSFTPIVNPPEVAILGLSRTRWQPVVVDGGFESRLMLPLSLSYDHRVINGADGARFISRLALLLGDLFELLSAT
jgi:pyruvate dehydrogenase E2 component (dihydrolipoamide acetyltransferase)